MAQSADPTATQCVSEGSASGRAVTASSDPSSSMTSVGCVEGTTPAAQKSWEPSPKRGTDPTQQQTHLVVQIVTVPCAACFLSLNAICFHMGEKKARCL